MNLGSISGWFTIESMIFEDDLNGDRGHVCERRGSRHRVIESELEWDLKRQRNMDPIPKLIPLSDYVVKVIELDMIDWSMERK